MNKQNLFEKKKVVKCLKTVQFGAKDLTAKAVAFSRCSDSVLLIQVSKESCEASRRL